MNKKASISFLGYTLELGKDAAYQLIEYAYENYLMTYFHILGIPEAI